MTGRQQAGDAIEWGAEVIAVTKLGRAQLDASFDFLRIT